MRIRPAALLDGSFPLRRAERRDLDAIRGLGAAMMEWAVEQGRHHGAGLVQLTSNAQRKAAHRFYRRLGFEASHLGFKCYLGIRN